MWEYRVSHGLLLIRSPQSASENKNLDIICVGVEYLELPRFIHGIEILGPTVEEVQKLEDIVGKNLDVSSILIIVSSGRRFPIVAARFKVYENDKDIFEDPFG
jgi:hypothetical protein